MVSASPLAVARARFTRFWIACGVLVLLLGDVWHLPHLLLARHVVCGEHGELVHVDDSAPGTASSAESPDAPAIDAHEATVHAHEHCTVFATSVKGAALASVPQATVAGALALESVLAVFAPDWQPSLPVLSYAPKQSPPV